MFFWPNPIFYNQSFVSASQSKMLYRGCSKTTAPKMKKAPKRGKEKAGRKRPAFVVKYIHDKNKFTRALFWKYDNSIGRDISNFRASWLLLAFSTRSTAFHKVALCDYYSKIQPGANPGKHHILFAKRRNYNRYPFATRHLVYGRQKRAVHFAARQKSCTFREKNIFRLHIS